MRCRGENGSRFGANLDPSHLMAMGADIPTVIRTVCESIIHVHATDTRINTTVTFWADFVYTLSSVGHTGR